MLTYWQLCTIEEHADTLAGASDIIGPPRHQSHYVFVQDAHFKLGQIWAESDASEFLAVK